MIIFGKNYHCPMIQMLCPEHWTDYELLDCGNFEKLERFGAYVLIRPEPQAIWEPVWPETRWKHEAHARFVRSKKQQHEQRESLKGGWTMLKNMPQRWQITYKNNDFTIKLKLSLTSFGHIGVFPEQACNWDFIYTHLKQMPGLHKSVLSLFAYTGAASLAARAAGADVVHLDSVKQVVAWAGENMEQSGYDNIRWVVEDALTFVKREVKRGKRYDAVIMDPPAYGRGPSGEKWTLQNGLPEIMKSTARLLNPDNGMFVLNLYSMGFSSLIGLNLANQAFPDRIKETGEFYLCAKSGVKLPLGTFLRF